MKRQPIYGIDAIRFFAALAVVLFHLAYKPFALETDSLHVRLGDPVFVPLWSIISWWGWIGVQIFFVISGLVIAYSATNATPYSFFRSRVARLLPAMLICASLIGVVAVGWGGADLSQTAILWIKSVTFFPFGPWLAGQFWTLGVEIAFYAVVWSMIMSGVINRLEVLAWVLCLLSASYWVLVTASFIPESFLPRITQLLLLQNGCYFALGIVLSIADGKGMSSGRWLLTLICAMIAWFQISTTLTYEAPAYSASELAVVPYLIWVAAMAAIGASLYWKDEIGQLIGSKGRYWRAAGLATYPLYLIHIHAGGPVLVGMKSAGASSAVAWISATGAAIAVAYGIALVLEPPVHRFVLALFSRLSAAIGREARGSTAA